MTGLHDWIGWRNWRNTTVTIRENGHGGTDEVMIQKR